LEEDLRRSRRRYADLYERLPIGIYRRTEDGVGLDANPKLIEMFGYPDEETFLAVDPYDLYVDPADRQRWLKLMYEHGLVMNFDVEYKRYDGTSFWGRNRARLVRDESGKQVVEGAVVDISEEKALDEELRATLADLRRAGDERRRLLTHLVKAKEDERNRVASDIHDDSVQVMTSVAIDLERLSRRLQDPEQQHVLEQLESRVRDAVGRLRTMVFELRPPTLEEEGVGSALRLYLEEFTLDTGIAHDMTNRLDPEPDNPARIVLYRIAQEALTNVRKHSGASNVAIDLVRVDGGIAMTVADDGAGFDVAESLEDRSPGHIGVSEMRERAEISGGTFEVSSEKDVGTKVRVWLPELVP
jgi:PAS domain S-box-containing protein